MNHIETMEKLEELIDQVENTARDFIDGQAARIAELERAEKAFAQANLNLRGEKEVLQRALVSANDSTRFHRLRAESLEKESAVLQQRVEALMRHNDQIAAMVANPMIVIKERSTAKLAKFQFEANHGMTLVYTDGSREVVKFDYVATDKSSEYEVKR